MGNDVFANGREISCKKADGKSICAFPDVCMTPPENPATPPGVPVPYPNTGMASDTTGGSKKVKISGQEVILKNKSSFKKSTGDEAGSAAKKGVVTSTNRGKVFFKAWSMDVKFEGENVVRHLDLTTHNHMSDPPNTPPWPYMDSMALDCSTNPCNKSGDAQKVKDNCGSPPADDYSSKCCEARKCMLVPYSPNKCCPKGAKQKTPHHVVPKSQFKMPGKKGASLHSNYKPNKAPCICATGKSHSVGMHGKIHTETNNLTVNHPSVQPHVKGKSIDPNARWEVGEAESVGAQAVANKTGCDKDCIEAQTRNGHNSMGIKKTDKIRPTTAGRITQTPGGKSAGF